jgi:multiple sugar transport system permease protein
MSFPAHVEDIVEREEPPAVRGRGGRFRPRGSWLEVILLTALAIVMLFPVVWIIETSLKQQRDIYAVPAKFVSFAPTLSNYKNVFIDPITHHESALAHNLTNSIFVAGFSTLLAIVLGVPAAWAYSRFNVRAKKEQLFFILSTRFMPPVVVVIPIFLMYSNWLDLYDRLFGLVLLYGAFNLPFTIWMMKGFVDEVPSEYEDAAMTDGYSRFEAFWRVTLPLLVPGIAATAVFALIFAWNEFVFALFLIPDSERQTAPPAIAKLVGGETIDWGLVAASAMVFAAPVLAFTVLVRKHLVAGVTLGAVRR